MDQQMENAPNIPEGRTPDFVALTAEQQQARVGACAQALLSFPPRDADRESMSDELYHRLACSHASRLGKLAKGDADAIALNWEELLEALDPNVQSMSYLTVLELALPRNDLPEPSEEVLLCLVHFLCRFESRQVRYVGGQMRELLENVVSKRWLPPSLSVKVVVDALLRIDPAGSTFTSTHTLVARFAYQTRCYREVLPLITRTILDFPHAAGEREPPFLCTKTLAGSQYINKSTRLSLEVKSLMVLEYYYLVGTIHCALRQWSQAAVAFEEAMLYPSHDMDISTIMLSAHSRWILTLLLSKGHARPATLFTAGHKATTYATLNAWYFSLAAAFSMPDPSDLRRVWEADTKPCVLDNNLGLGLEILASYQKWQILNLRTIFRRVSISDIRAQTQSAETGEPLSSDDEVVALVQGMIESGMLDGVVEPPDADGVLYLHFFDQEALSEKSFASNLAEAAASIKVLGDAYRRADEKLGTSKEYIRHLLKERKLVKDGEMGFGFEAQVVDEDIMAGPK